MTTVWASKRINIFDKKALFFQGQWTAVYKIDQERFREYGRK